MFYKKLGICVVIAAMQSCASGGPFVELERQNAPQRETHSTDSALTVAVAEEPDETIDEERRLRDEVAELERKQRLRQLKEKREALLREEQGVQEPAAESVQAPAPDDAAVAAPKAVPATPVTLPGDQDGLVTSFRKGDPTVIMIDIGSDDNLQEDQYIIVKQNNKKVCRAKLVRVSKSKSMAYVTTDDWEAGVEVTVMVNDPVYLEE